MTLNIFLLLTWAIIGVVIWCVILYRNGRPQNWTNVLVVCLPTCILAGPVFLAINRVGFLFDGTDLEDRRR